MGRGFQYTPAVWREFLALGNVSTAHRVSLVPWGTLQIRFGFVRQRSFLSLKQTNEKLVRLWKMDSNITNYKVNCSICFRGTSYEKNQLPKSWVELLYLFISYQPLKPGHFFKICVIWARCILYTCTY